MFYNRLSKKSDEELVRLLQQGSERALTELYTRYSKKLVRYFYRMLWRDEATAQDFLHDLFVKLMEVPHRVDASRPFSTWLYSAAHNMCKNEYRKRDRRKETVGSVNVEPVECMDLDMDQRTFEQELEKVFLKGDENDKGLFIMRYEMDMTVAEIAVILEIPEGTVKSKLFYLKKRLAERLQLFNPVA